MEDDIVQVSDEQKEEQRAKAEASATLRKWNGLIERGISDSEKQHKKFKAWRDAVDLKKIREHSQRPIKPYLIFSTLSSLIPALYAKNPEIEIRPSAVAASAVNGEMWVEFAQTAENLVQRELVTETKLKKKMKGCLLSTLTTGIGWLKVTLQSEYRKDPLQHARIPDVQDNIASIDALRKQLKEAGADDEKIESEIRDHLATLERSIRGESEAFVQKGLVVDKLSAEDVLILDDSIGEIQDYESAAAIAHRVWMSADEYRKQFGKEDIPSSARRTGREQRDYLPRQKNGDDGDAYNDCVVEVWEVWSKDTGLVYTFARGAKEFAREPYTPVSSERFYPFFCLAFNNVDGRFWPLSDVETLIDYQEEYSHMRSQLRDTRQYNKPVYAVPRTGDLSAVDANRLIQTLRDDERGTWLAVGGINPNQPISSSIQQIPIPQINQSLFDPSMVFRDVEMTTRSGDAARGYINKAKTATEAEIMSMGMQSGISERQDVMEDMMRDMARHALEIMIRHYTVEEVQRILGAGVAWDNFDIDTTYRYLSVDIRAGSMSKPNKFQEREQWTQFMPVFQNTITQMSQLIQQGQHSMAMALRKMLEETVTRFDERINLDEFSPDFSADMAGMQQMQQQQMAEQLQQQALAQGIQDGQSIFGGQTQQTETGAI